LTAWAPKEQQIVVLPHGGTACLTEIGDTIAIGKFVRLDESRLRGLTRMDRRCFIPPQAASQRYELYF
jgi:hypothetical protein